VTAVKDIQTVALPACLEIIKAAIDRLEPESSLIASEAHVVNNSALMMII